VFILFIIFFAFAKTASDPAFIGHLGNLALPFAYLAVSHLLLLALAALISRLFRLNKADRITVLFTAPQKTLAMGIPLLSTFFGADAAVLGIALLPLVFYHPWQLLVAGVMLRFLEPERAKA
jgi:predicted Na+-dependent transporter